MMHVVSFSTGLSSALTAERVFQRFGAEDVWIVFCDTTVEDEDNYRFQEEIYARWREVYGAQNFVTLRDGRTPLEVAEDRNILPNQRRAPCTYQLKIKPFVQWLREQDEEEITIYIGFDYEEQHRCGPVSENYEKAGFAVDFPLLWKPIEFRPYPEVCKEEWGLEPPRMYEFGYTHANCGGCCVKQGMGDWARTLIRFPERYERYEAWERWRREDARFEEYAFLRDFRGGDVTP